MARDRKMIEFVCNCGVVVRKRADTKHSRVSCDSCSKKASAKINDLSGKEFPNFTVVADSGQRCPSGSVIWACRCKCGSDFPARASVIREGSQTLSCGCRRYTKQENLISESPEYKSYYMMLDRCHNSNNPNFAYYGGRGVTVDPSWVGADGVGFKQFLADMGPRPEGTSIERIYVDKGYSPSNCKWGTDAEQGHTRRKQTGTSSKYKGVCHVKSGNFRSYISKHHKRIELGTFQSEVHAAELYDCASLIWYGADSYINFEEKRNNYMKAIEALAVGQRGHKDALTDYKDIVASAQRALELHQEWEGV